MSESFWETKSLDEMTTEEWESLCDGCGKCCLFKFQDEDTDEMFFTNVSCKLFDAATCRCSSYVDRFKKVPDCADIRKFTQVEMQWLPQSCAYRLLFEGKKLKPWHPLVSGDPGSVHKAGISMKDNVINESDADADLDNLESYIDERLI